MGAWRGCVCVSDVRERGVRFIHERGNGHGYVVWAGFVYLWSRPGVRAESVVRIEL